MARTFDEKINQIIVAPNHIVLTSKWLDDKGISPKLAWWYVHSGLLEKLAAKAFKKSSDSVGWTGALYALQKQLELNIHLGGSSALSLFGLAHYVELGSGKNIQIFSNTKCKYPSWFLNKKMNWSSHVTICKTELFNNDKLNDYSFVEKEVDSLPLTVSSPERAVLELLYLYPKHENLDSLHKIFEGLHQLRPSIIQKLLEQCVSIKVKRLFLHLADLYELSWLEKIDLNTISLGSGKRSIGGGGVYHPKFKISLPEYGETGENDEVF